MKPLFVRSLSAEERHQLEAGLRSRDAFTLRRCQVLLASADGTNPSEIARHLGCVTQTVRNAIRCFEAEGLSSLQAKSSRPQTLRTILDQEKSEALRALLHQSPRTLGKSQSTWTLELAAKVCHERGISEVSICIETVRQALKRLGVGWHRAKDWITSPDPQYRLKKNSWNA